MQQRMEAERAAAERQAAMPYATSDAVSGYGGRIAMGIGDGFYTAEEMAERCVLPVRHMRPRCRRSLHTRLRRTHARTHARCLPPSHALTPSL